jgi:hypothetical protein
MRSGKAMQLIYSWPIWISVLGLAIIAMLGSEVGYRLAKLGQSGESDRTFQVSERLKASIIALVALLFGFSYSVTTSRYHERERFVLDEANAIGTCYLRAGLLSEPARSQIRGVLRHYTDLRLALYKYALEPGVTDKTRLEMGKDLDELWSTVELEASNEPETVRTSLIVSSANEVIDLSSTRDWLNNDKLPAVVILLLGLCIVISSTLVGHSSGEVGKRNLGLWISMNILIAMVFFVILDFDRSHRGLIRVDHEPLIELRQSMNR